jgi:hypothetical protein
MQRGVFPIRVTGSATGMIAATGLDADAVLIPDRLKVDERGIEPILLRKVFDSQVGLDPGFE